jgi:hypothetical protein
MKGARGGIMAIQLLQDTFKTSLSQCDARVGCGVRGVTMGFMMVAVAGCWEI